MRENPKPLKAVIRIIDKYIDAEEDRIKQDMEGYTQVSGPFYCKERLEGLREDILKAWE
jgi:hypothetical protein